MPTATLHQNDAQSWLLIISTLTHVRRYKIRIGPTSRQLEILEAHQEVKSDDVKMLCLKGTPDGRVFMGGDDGLR